ncbi:MAG: alkaline phosphatase family protein [Pseudomonadota bacterium]
MYRVLECRRMAQARQLVAAAALGMAITAPALAAGSANLIVNGNAEASTCTPDWNAVTTVPGWTITKGSPSVVCYAIASFATPTPGAGAKAFFADGPYGDASIAQDIDVSAAAAQIDTGAVTFNLSGWLGGWGALKGDAKVNARFLSASGATLASAQLAGDTPAARGNKNAFIALTRAGAVPAGTRAIAVSVDFTVDAISFNQGYADNLSLTLSTPVTAATLTPPPSKVPPFDHVFFIMMENTNYDAIVGSPNAPFINSLIARGTLLSNYTGTYHPSDENYLSVAGGDTFVQGAIYFPNINVDAPHLGDRIEAVGKSWKSYEQGMGTPCNLNKVGYYSPDDAPFSSFISVSKNPTRCQAHLFDTSQLTVDLQTAATTPHFSWIAADDYYDGEAAGQGNAASVQVQDAWLRQTVQPILDSPAWKNERSLLMLTWDESYPDQRSNRVATVLVGSQNLVRAAALSSAPHNHYSATRTIEGALGLAPLTANDQYAAAINDAFVTPPLSAPTGSVARGANIALSYQAPAGLTRPSNWVAIYAAGQAPGTTPALVWQYAPTSSGIVGLSTSNLAAGNYVAWYLFNDGYTVLGGPLSFKVTLQ